MSMKIDVYSLYNAHYYGQCQECEFTVGVGESTPTGRLSEAEVRNKIRQHVKKHKHQVVLDSSKSTYYQPDGYEK